MPATVLISRRPVLISRGSRRPVATLYTATGPDGARFDNQSRAEIARVIRRRYGRGVVIRDA
jgi:hypothetical protein